MSLDKVLALAAVDLLDPQELAGAHRHLTQNCAWYRAVCAGHCATRPDEHCKAVQVKLTAHTAEASTVDKPTVPPGGPGLFRIKGLHLPPYFQHLWYHLVKEYGKHKAYGVAIGIVHKWAKGVNPGGKHPTKTHPDVRAAAQKTIEQWEKDRAKAHDRHHVKATVPATPGAQPGLPQIPLPPVPRNRTAAAMFTAHRVDENISQLAHAKERVAAAKATSSEHLRGYYADHISNHLIRALHATHQEVDNLKRNYPAEYAELEKLTATVGCAAATSNAAKICSFAHLLQTLAYNLGHAKRHADALRASTTPSEARFNLDHVSRHVDGGLEHALKLAEHLRDNYPEEGKWLKELETAEGRTAGKYGKIVAQGSGNENVKLAARVVASAPGTRPIYNKAASYAQYGLWQSPSQTTAASPPLPPDAKLPSPKEIRQVAADLANAGNDPLLVGAAAQARAAADKMATGDHQGALAGLRSAQSGLYSYSKTRIAGLVPVASVFVSRVPPAEQSSANAAMFRGLAERQKLRALNFKIAVLLDRIRRHFFHGQWNGRSEQGRF